MPDGSLGFTVLGPTGIVEPVERYLAVRSSSGASPNTVLAIARDLAQFLVWLDQRGLAYDRVSLADLGDYVRHLRTTTARAERALRQREADGTAVIRALPGQELEGRSAATAQRHLSSLFGFYEHVGFELDVPLGRQLRSFSRSRGARLQIGGSWLNARTRPMRLAVPARRPAALSADEVRLLLLACEHLRDRLLLALLWSPGLRVGQVLGLRHADFDGRRATVSVVPRDSNPRDARAKRPPHAGPLVLPLEPAIVGLHSEYMHTEYGDIDSDYLFINLWGGQQGRRMTYQGVRSILARLQRRTGIAFTPHMLRHSFATDLLSSGASKELVQALLGHASIQTTDIYDHRTVEHMRAELDRLQRGEVL
jgi:site-specific recombinase XerD